ncbi:MAG: hypothetical protein SV186_03485 [Candidatus Nanohaloarchaea archaeon]|nr:hypothetical protein [Candidatus Nanohaloarchaea archaeon]
MAATVDDFLNSRRINTYIGWLIVLLLTTVIIESILDIDIVWAGFTGFVTCILILPSIANRTHRILIPWEFLLLATMPIIARALDIAMLHGPLVNYLSFAALALIVSVEIHVYTETRMTHWFAVILVALTTTASAGLWAIARWLSDNYLRTALLPDNQTLMMHFLAATAVGIGAGILFDIYFTQLGREVNQP